MSYSISTLKSTAFAITGTYTVAGLKIFLEDINPLFVGDFRTKQAWLDAIEVVAWQYACDAPQPIGDTGFTAQSTDWCCTVRTAEETQFYWDTRGTADFELTGICVGDDDGRYPFDTTSDQFWGEAPDFDVNIEGNVEILTDEDIEIPAPPSIGDTEGLVKSLTRSMDKTDAALAALADAVGAEVDPLGPEGGWEAAVCGEYGKQLELFPAAPQAEPVLQPVYLDSQIAQLSLFHVLFDDIYGYL
jgi:hypothetical protein